MERHEYSFDRTSVLVRSLERSADALPDTYIPWTDDPENNPDIAANTDFQKLWAQVQAGEVTIQEPTPPIQTQRGRRAQAYIDELGIPNDDLAETVAEVLYIMLKEYNAFIKAKPATPEFSATLAKIEEIRARYPDPS